MSQTRVIVLRNVSQEEFTFNGIMIGTGVSYTVPVSDIPFISADVKLFECVADGCIVVSNGITDLDPINGWNWIQGNVVEAHITQESEVGTKIWVHNSAKPEKPNKSFYVYWTGAGDDVENGALGEGDPTFFVLTANDAKKDIDVKFDFSKGDFYIHEGHLLWDGAGIGDYFESFIMSEPSLIQPIANLDLILDGAKIKYSPSGPGTGTHGFAAIPSPVPNYNNEGAWDFDKETEILIPNMTNEGGWDLFTEEKQVARFINKIPMYSNSHGYETLDSDDTFRVFPGYFIRCTAHNISGTDWVCTFYLTAFRERTLS